MIDLNRKVYEPSIGRPDRRSMILYEPSIVSQILHEPTSEFVGGVEKKVINVKRDISILLNQVRLDNINMDSLLNYFKERPNDSTISELRKKCSDEQLLQLCKSRYIQRPSELQGYFDFLEHNYDAEIKNIISQEQQINAETSDGTGSEEKSEGV